MDICYVKNQEIDKKRWDRLIDEAPNGRVYAYSWYLDIVAPKWDALIGGDYEYVMPVPHHLKYGITCSFTPYFVQQLGVYSRKELTDEIATLFIGEIPGKIRYVNLQINIPEPLALEGIKFTRRTNYILDIDRPYDEIKAGYKPDAKNKLNKANHFRLVETDDIAGVVAQNQQWNGHLTPFVDKDYDTMFRLMDRAKRENRLRCCILLDENDEINASGFLLMSHGRAYHLLNAQSPAGRQKGAMHFFIDGFIRQYCRQIKIYDFEGSVIPGVAMFFQKWGSVPEYYMKIERIRFPVSLVR